MELALARKQALAEQTLRALERAPLVKAFVVRNEHVAHVVGVVQEEDALRPRLEAHNVAVLAREPREKIERVAPEVEDAAAGPHYSRPRRLRPGLHAFLRGYHLETPSSAFVPSGLVRPRASRADFRAPGAAG